MPNLLLFPALETPEPPRTRSGAPDAPDRQQALDISRSWIVEAPAGSGKTGLLIQRFLKLLAYAEIEQPEQVLAITFTVKATAEMSERVLSQLEAAAADRPVADPFAQETRLLARAVLRRDAAAGWNLLQSPRRLNIRTIDSVCAEIARALPLLSGSGGARQPTLEPRRLYREAARRTLAELGGPDTELHRAIETVLLHRDGNLANCEKLIAGMLEMREQWGRLVPLLGRHLTDEYLDAAIFPRLERALELAICQALTQLSRAMPPDLLRELTAAAAELAHLEGYKGEVSPIAACKHRDEPPEDRAGHLELWRALIHLVTTGGESWRKGFNKNQLNFEIQKHQKPRLTALVDRLQHHPGLLQTMCAVTALPPAHYPREQWLLAKALFRVLSRALAELQIVFAASSECDFAEVGLAARTALAGDATVGPAGSGVDDLAAALGVRTHHLLVDEMQDTSTGQYELIERLTEGWDGASQTLFLVGDPKQSIYRFRQARVERFVRTVNDRRLGHLSLGVLRLTANFRSDARLVEQWNEGFSQIFPSSIDLARPEEVRFSPSIAPRGHGASPGLVWHVHIVPSGEDREATRELRRRQARDDARAIRELAAGWLARPLPPGRTEPWRVAVLVRARAHLAAVITEFQRDRGAGPLPFRAVEVEELGERQEILDLLSITRALLHPADRVAWLAILRAPWCGLGLADLHMLTGTDVDGPTLRQTCIPDLVHARGHLLSPEGEARLARCWPVLAAAQAQRGRLPIAQWVERTWRSLGGDSYLGPAEQANVHRFFTLLDELAPGGGAVDLPALRDRIKRLYAEPAMHPGAVDLLTIHRAKGLEWDVVFVPALERRAPFDAGRLLNWIEIDSDDPDGASAVLAPIAAKGGDAGELNDWIRGVHSARDAAERKRLLYVACTRAREELHLFAMPDAEAKTGNPAVQPSSLLKAAWPMAEPQFAAAPRALLPTRTPIPFPAPIAALADRGAHVVDLAASSESVVPLPAGNPTLLRRLPMSFDGAERLTRSAPLPYGTSGPTPAFDRPEGSFSARCFGKAVHVFLEFAARRLAQGDTLSVMQAEVPTWLPRAAALLRADGLAPAVVERHARRVIDDLRRTLADPAGQWVLSAHAEAASELAIPRTDTEGDLRLDRIFRAGPAPGEHGTTHLWIVDWKTGTHGLAGVEEFLADERARYAPQLEAYAGTAARALASCGTSSSQTVPPIHVALYYPALSRLVWWVAEVS